MMRAFLSRLRRDSSGVATIEFALLSVLFFGVMMAALDIGIWFQQRLRLDAAVEQGAMLAFNQRAGLDTAAATSIGNFVASAAKLKANPVVVVGCNGGTNNCASAGRNSFCVSGSPPSVTYTQTTNPCGDGSLPGYYMTITATATSSTVVMPATLLGGALTQTRRAVVRLQ